jgi:hypothetical protein
LLPLLWSYLFILRIIFDRTKAITRRSLYRFQAQEAHVFCLENQQDNFQKILICNMILSKRRPEESPVRTNHDASDYATIDCSTVAAAALLSCIYFVRLRCQRRTQSCRKRRLSWKAGNKGGIRCKEDRERFLRVT